MNKKLIFSESQDVSKGLLKKNLFFLECFLVIWRKFFWNLFPNIRQIFLLFIIMGLVSGCFYRKKKPLIFSQRTYRPYKIRGKTFYPLTHYHYKGRGMASFYGRQFHGKRTASGEIFDSRQYTAAHRTLPMHTIVCVTCLKTGKKVCVRINDRGPFERSKRKKAGRIIDLSQGAAEALGIKRRGIAMVQVEVLKSQTRNFLRNNVVKYPRKKKFFSK